MSDISSAEISTLYTIDVITRTSSDKNLAQASLRIFEWWRGLEQSDRQKHFRLFCALERLKEHRHGVDGGLGFDELHSLGKAGRDAFLTQIIRDERSKIANAIQGD